LYTVLLIISLVAIILGTICLYLETDSSEYPGKPPYKNLPAVSMSTIAFQGPSAFA
jgi:membrane protein CcdC involved in cytochrome C biogenesis